jgi:hypothetical protein
MYYIENNNKVVLFDEDLSKLQDTVRFMPQYKDFEIKEVQEGYIIVDFELITIEEKEQRELEKAKQAKLQENEVVREQFLISGVEYKDILWDSDIEQKLNISIQLSNMSDEDTVNWVAMDGITSLECTKEDLLNIGALLTQMTAYVWQYKNPQIKTMINNAQTIEEVNAIQIVYDMSEIVPPEPEPQPVDDDSDSDIDIDIDTDLDIDSDTDTDDEVIDENTTD